MSMSLTLMSSFKFHQIKIPTHFFFPEKPQTKMLESTSNAESQNHRMAKVRMQLSKSPSPNHHSEQSHLVKVVHGCVHLCFDFLKGWRFYSLFG